MAADLRESPRFVVPRWRTHNSFLSLPEHDPLKSGAHLLVLDHRSNAQFEELTVAWKENPTFSFAADLISAALVIGKQSEAIDAAEYVLQNREASTPASIFLAEKVLGIKHLITPIFESRSNTQIIRSELCLLKKHVRDRTFNPFSWADLAFCYQVVGCREKAERCLTTALSLAPENRFIIRATCRMYLHNDDPERALRVLHRAKAIKSDPWLLAAEIAVCTSTKKTSRLLRDARGLVESGHFEPLHLSELQSALGTFTAQQDTSKKALKLIRSSIIAPTENAIAQAAWFSRFFNVEINDTFNEELTLSAEANAYDHFLDARWSSALDESQKWWCDQRFSSRPPLLASYIASLTNDFFESIKICKAALKANPEDSTLRNNLAFALAKSGDIKGARPELAKARRNSADDGQEAVLDATEGLILFREGKFLEATTKYKSAMDYFASCGEKLQYARAYLNYAIEALKYDKTNCTIVLMEIEKLGIRRADVDLLKAQVIALCKS